MAAHQSIKIKPATTVRQRRKRKQLFAVVAYSSLLFTIFTFASAGYQSPVQDQTTKQSAEIIAQIDNPSIDQIVAADLAASTAQTANLAVSANASSLSISLNTKSELSQTDDSLLAKPQISQSNEHRGITEYTAIAGDTVQAVAAKFSVSPQTVSWANNLTSDALSPGKTLLIPGTDGVVYTVKSGDTAESISSKYKVDQSRLVTYNDLEVSGIVAGMRIVLPDGQLPETERPGYVAPRSTSTYKSAYTISGFDAAASVGNKYAYGYCTWYAYNRRAAIGRPVGSYWGNASSWAFYASAAGYRVDRNPEVGAVMQNGGGYGHVAVVEKVNADGSIRVSEMNYAGWNVVSSRDLSAGQAVGYNFIH